MKPELRDNNDWQMQLKMNNAHKCRCQIGTLIETIIKKRNKSCSQSIYQLHIFHCFLYFVVVILSHWKICWQSKSHNIYELHTFYRSDFFVHYRKYRLEHFHMYMLVFLFHLILFEFKKNTYNTHLSLIIADNTSFSFKRMVNVTPLFYST